MIMHRSVSDLGDRVVADDPIEASARSYDVALIGAGILGSALAYSLANSGRSVLLVERDLAEPDRIVGELLQPGGCMALRRLGIDSVLDGIDSVKVQGYQIFWGDATVDIPYPEETVEMSWSKGGLGKEERRQEGRSFHHGRIVQNLRRTARSAANVTLIEGTVNVLLRDGDKITGISVTPKSKTLSSDPSPPLHFKAKLTFATDGCFSKFRRELLPVHVTPRTRSNFVGLILEDANLPAPYHGHVILRRDNEALAKPTRRPSPATSPIGPVLVYQLSERETRMLVDVRGAKVPAAGGGQLADFLDTHVTPVLPPSLVPSFSAAVRRSRGDDKSHRLRSMPNSFLPPYPQGRGPPGAVLAGDALNMRHPLTGGGMTVAFNDAVILTQLLGGGEPVGLVKGDERGVADLEDWEDIRERLEDWHWRRKGVASCINVLAMALYDLFGADDDNLEVLKVGCFKYFELGGDRVQGPVSLLSAIKPSPLLLFYHFFSVCFYSIWCMFTMRRPTDDKRPSVLEYPALTLKGFQVFWTACIVILPTLWSEGQM